MTSIVPAFCILCLVTAFTVLHPATAKAAELESIYVRVRISPDQYRQWLASPMKHMHEFTDWNMMTDDWEDNWKKSFYTWDYKTIGDMVKAREDEMASPDQDPFNSRPYIGYDEKEGVFTFAQLVYDENYINFLLDLSAYRTLADFKDTDGPDFAVIYPYIWDPGYTVIMAIGKSSVTFHTEENAPPEFTSFIATANAHFEKEIKELSQ